VELAWSFKAEGTIALGLGHAAGFEYGLNTVVVRDASGLLGVCQALRVSGMT
jgi:hypothetical protein